MRRKGFTLSELLIALAILGVIATFTIPKVLQSQQNGEYKAIGKETVGMIAQAYQLYRAANTPNSNTSPADLTPYMNYVAVDTTANTMDHAQTMTTLNPCSWSQQFCLRLHNGGMLNIHAAATFGGTSSTHALYFFLDPDGTVTDGTTNGPGKSVLFFLYYDGKVRTAGTVLPNTTTNWTTFNPDPTLDPPWFNWN